jgi:hypothetical protein
VHRRFLPGLAVLLASLGAAPSASATPDDDLPPLLFSDAAEAEARVRALESQVSALRGLPFLRQVPVEIERPDVARADAIQDLHEDMTPEEIRQITLTWYGLGLVGWDFDLVETFGEALELGVAGYFDVEEERLVLVRRPPEPDDPTGDDTIAHELVHALQTQHLGLARTVDWEWRSSDARLAYEAVIEGDASWTARPWSGRADLEELELARSEGRNPEPWRPGRWFGAEMPFPRILVEGLLFPYGAGPAFVEALLHARGQAGLNAAFAAPPVSTEQVLHPERFLGPTPDWPTVFTARKPERWLGADWDLLDEDTLGELQMGTWMRHHRVAPSVVAETTEGWDGDRAWVYTRGPRQVGVLWMTTWDTPADAEHFQETADRVLGVDPASPLGHRRRTDGPATEVYGTHRKGQDVLVFLGIPADRVDRAIRRALRVDRREVRDVADMLDPVAPSTDAPE